MKYILREVLKYCDMCRGNHSDAAQEKSYLRRTIQEGKMREEKEKEIFGIRMTR